MMQFTKLTILSLVLMCSILLFGCTQSQPQVVVPDPVLTQPSELTPQEQAAINATPITDTPLDIPTPAQTVIIKNFAFTPSDITIKVGDTVLWQNNDSVEHTVTSNDGTNELSSQLLLTGDTYYNTFTKKGIYTYHCTNYIAMSGTITVQ